MREARFLPYLQIAPLLFVLVGFLLIPITMVAVVSFFDYDSFRVIPDFILLNYEEMLFSETTWRTLWSTVRFTLIVLGLTAILGFLIAYHVAFYVRSKAMQTVFFLACTIPFLTSNIIRMISWVPYLGRNGILNSILMQAGVVAAPLDALLYSNFAVILVYVYLYTLFMVTPLGARFAQGVLEIEAGGGTRTPVNDGLQRFFFVLSGTVTLRIGDAPAAEMTAEGFAYVPPGVPFALRNAGSEQARVLGLKKPYERIDLPAPDPILSHRSKLEKVNHNGTEGRTWEHCLPFGDFAFDIEMNILSFTPGAYFPDVETHIMEHGLFMLEGQGMYLLGQDWHEVWKDDFIWMGPYCPQLFYPTGWGTSAYLLYKNVNRDVVF